MVEKRSNVAENTSDREIVISRLYDAPRELVWEAWTNPKHVAKWWGPTGFTTTIEQMDVRVGGIWKQVLHGPDGANYPNQSKFLEVVKHERIVYAHTGNKEGGSHVNHVTTWTFAERDGKTEVTLWMVFPSTEARDLVIKEFGALEGGKQTLGRLGEQLSKMNFGHREVSITRIVDAPRELVWRAWTDPKHLSAWWGPNLFTTPVCEVDLKIGGALRIVMKGPDGIEHTMTGVFQKIEKPSLLAYSFSATDKDETPLLEGRNTAILEDLGGKTKLTVIGRAVGLAPISPQMLAGMQEGWTQSLVRLEAYLAKG